MKTHFQNVRRRAGFTLLELMVAMGITAIIVTVLVTITGIATDTWTSSRAEIRAARQAKAMLDTMADDFQSLVSRRGNNFEWLVAETGGGQNPMPTVVRAGGGSQTPAEITFLTAATDRYAGQVGGDFPDNNGDISCVSYRLRYQDPITGQQDADTSTFVLYRRLVNPDETFQNLLGQEDLAASFQSYEGSIDEQANFICENVHQFTMTFHVEVTPDSGGDSSAAEPPRTVRVTMSSNNPGNFQLTGTGIETSLTASGASSDELESGRLKAVELSISVLSDAGVTRMQAGDGLSEDDYARHVRHYSRVVDVPSM